MDKSIDSIIVKAVLRVLKPLIRILLRHEISHKEFAEIARKAYVDVAYEDYSLPNRKMTYSRAAVITGLSRKEVVRLKELDENQEQISLTKVSLNRAGRVVSGWISDKRFTVDDKPEKLSLSKADEFPLLVSEYSGDITAGAILDELLRLNLVEVSQEPSSDPLENTSEKYVSLIKTGYLPEKDELERLRIISQSAANLLDTGAHNIANDPSLARYQRQFTYNDIPRPVIEQFKPIAEEKSQALLLELFQTLSDMRDKYETASQLNNNEINPEDLNNQAETKAHRVGLGIYYFESKHSQDD